MIFVDIERWRIVHLKCVYAVVFTNGNVKFGRSRNLIRRVGEHVTGAKQHGISPSVILSASVVDEVRAESDILRCAASKLIRVSQETFSVGGLSDVAECFWDCGFDFFVFRVLARPFRLELDPLSFDISLPEVIPIRPVLTRESAMDRLKARIVGFLSDKPDGEYVSDLKKNVGTARMKDVESCLDELVDDGYAVRFYSRSRAGIELRTPQTRKIKLMEFSQ